MSKTTHKLRRQIIGPLLILIGIVLLTFPKAYKILASSNLTPLPASNLYSSTPDPIKIDLHLLSNQSPSDPPTRIVISRLEIDLPITESPVVNGQWQTSADTASHGVGSANPGTPGNIVVFAHAKPNLFLPLAGIGPNDQIYIFTTNRWYKYQVSDIQYVSPNQVQVIAPTPDETLTLFTCSGFLDTRRLVVTAKPITI